MGVVRESREIVEGVVRSGSRETVKGVVRPGSCDGLGAAKSLRE